MLRLILATRLGGDSQERRARLESRVSGRGAMSDEGAATGQSERIRLRTQLRPIVAVIR